jgi:hypothetical protein
MIVFRLYSNWKAWRGAETLNQFLHVPTADAPTTAATAAEDNDAEDNDADVKDYKIEFIGSDDLRKAYIKNAEHSIADRNTVQAGVTVFEVIADVFSMDRTLAEFVRRAQLQQRKRTEKGDDEQK